MAITKTHSIKSTLRKAIDYICNPDKTDGQILISSFGCSPETADIEFEWTRKFAQRESPNLAHHLIQSFAPNETTPEQAHEIGMRLAEEAFGGKYEFVLCTHIDKGSIHNHIIYNSVSFVDYKHFHSTPKSYYNTRRISDNLCTEYGLSVIEPSENKGKSYKEYAAAREGTSWKSKLKIKIDNTIQRSMDLDDFLLRMEIAGYEVKRGKYISFRAPGQQRFIRSKTLGTKYTKKNIIKRISNKSRYKQSNNKSINLIIDIQNNIKAQQSKGYEHWAKIHNLKQASKTVNFLTENNISSYEELESKVNELHAAFDEKRETVKSVENKLNNTAIILKNLNIYNEFIPIYIQYQKAKNKEQFERRHQRELILYKAADKALKASDNKLSLAEVQKEYSSLEDNKNSLYLEYRKLKNKCSEIDVIKKNIDMILNVQQRSEREQEPER